MRAAQLALIAYLLMPTLHGQGKVSVLFQSDAQWYLEDEVLDPTGEFYPDEEFLGQGHALITYKSGDFTAGFRYENYQNVMLGFPTGYRGEGIAYRYAQWQQGDWNFTVGNYYEQFGSGLIFRSYEERGLGLDNAMDGVRLIGDLGNGLQIKAVMGRQRLYFATGEGVLRGVDLGWDLTQPFPKLSDKGIYANIGASFVSKFQRGYDPILNLPNNVGAWAIRGDVSKGLWNWSSEYAYKINDPSYDNGYIYRPGQALISTLTFAKKGFGLLLSGKRIDNMSFRSDRNAQQFDLFVNFLPSNTTPHLYALPSLYPYATQINGEQGGQVEVSYQLPRGSRLGGKYGTLFVLNASIAQSIDKQALDDGSMAQAGSMGYQSDWLKAGEVPYFQDINASWSRKYSRSYKTMLTFYDLRYNKTVLIDGVGDAVILDSPNMDSVIHVQAVVWENQFRLANKQTLRSEIQLALADGYRGDMAMGLLEWTISSNWTLAAQDIYNYGHPTPSRRLHYPIVSVIHFNGPTRFQVGYGRQQQGVFCVGGVCRVVPPSNGLSISITSSL
jgi:hypothetical protein